MSNFFNIPVVPQKKSTYHITEQDKEYLKSFAVDGIIPFDVYIKAMNIILNKNKRLYTYPGTMLPPDELSVSQYTLHLSGNGTPTLEPGMNHKRESIQSPLTI